MLVPRKTKRRKWQRLRGSLKGKAHKNNRVSFGTYGLKAITGAEINSRQIEAARRTMTRFLKRGGKIWIKIFPHKPVSRKGAEVPMGKGKGAPDRFVANVRPGTVLFELEGITEEQAREATRLAAHKLPVKCKFVNSNVIY